MAKEKKESKVLEKIRTFFYVIVAVIAISTAVFGIHEYFAKTYDVRLINNRLDIRIIDDQIFQQEQTVQRIEDWKRFEQRVEEPKLSPIEKDILDKAKNRLKILVDRKEDKIKKYESEEK